MYSSPSEPQGELPFALSGSQTTLLVHSPGLVVNVPESLVGLSLCEGPTRKQAGPASGAGETLKGRGKHSLSLAPPPPRLRPSPAPDSAPARPWPRPTPDSAPPRLGPPPPPRPGPAPPLFTLDPAQTLGSARGRAQSETRPGVCNRHQTASWEFTSPGAGLGSQVVFREWIGTSSYFHFQLVHILTT